MEGWKEGTEDGEKMLQNEEGNTKTREEIVGTTVGMMDVLENRPYYRPPTQKWVYAARIY